MTQHNIFRLAKEAGAYWEHGDFNMPIPVGFYNEKDLIIFAQMIAAHEREEIAQIIENAPALVNFVKNDRGGCMICGFTPSIAASAVRSRCENR